MSAHTTHFNQVTYDELMSTSWSAPLINIVVVLAIIAAAAMVLKVVVKRLTKHMPSLEDVYRIVQPRLLLVLTIIGVWIALAITWVSEWQWWPAAEHVLRIGVALAFAWLMVGVVNGAFTRSINQLDESTPFSRRRRTQLILLRRLASVIIIVFIVGAVLFTFPAVRAIGVSLFASAGIVSVIAGLAAQSTFGNLIAGLQLTFSDALRVGDLVVVEGEYGYIGEITLTYVVVDVWDERRIILPCTYFTTQPFEQWTRSSDKIFGTIYFDMDWRVPIKEVRAEFNRILATSPEFDGRKSNCLITNAQGGTVEVRMTVSSRDADDVWDLRCRVREQIIEWLQTNHPDALPTQRMRLEAGQAPEAETPLTADLLPGGSELLDPDRA